MMDFDTLTFQPLVPEIVIIGCLILGLFLLVPTLLARRWNALFLRAFALVLVALVLAQPLLESRDEKALPTQVVILEDRSASQKITGRLESTIAYSEALIKSIEDNPSLEAVHHSFTEDEKKGGTRLLDQLRQISGSYRPERLGAVLLVTDGLVQDAAEELAPALKALDVPVHLLLTRKTEGVDRRIKVEGLPRYAVAGKAIEFSVTVNDDQADGEKTYGNPANLNVFLNGTPIWVGRIMTGHPESFNFTLDQRGDNVIELEVSPLEGEISTENNKVHLNLNGVRDSLRVLLVSGNLYPGIRVWRDLLKSDPIIDMVHFTILRTRFSQDATSNEQLSLIAFPAQELFEEKLDQFDLIISDRYSYRQILFPHYIDNIVRYVLGGGALMMVVGDEYLTHESLANTPLINLLPALPGQPKASEPFTPSLTEKGKRHPITRDLPGQTADGETGWGPWNQQIDAHQRDGLAILNGLDDQPLLILNERGEGRVAMLLSDNLWLWARDFTGGGPHRTLMRNLVHWLTKDPTLEAEALRGHMRGSDLLIERQSLSEEAPDLSLIQRDGSVEQVPLSEGSEPGLFHATVPMDGPADLTLASGPLRARVVPDPLTSLEVEKLVASESALKYPVAQSRGKVQTVNFTEAEAPPVPPALDLMAKSDEDRFGENWLGVIDRNVVEVTSVTQFFLLDGWLALLCLAISFMLLWWREGK